MAVESRFKPSNNYIENHFISIDLTNLSSSLWLKVVTYSHIIGYDVTYMGKARPWVVDTNNFNLPLEKHEIHGNKQKGFHWEHTANVEDTGHGYTNQFGVL